METQAISAPVDRLTREAPKHRQVGYGLPCAKCHKYFPADLEVCPICKGRERVSPVVAPRIPKPVQSETSIALSSTNVELKQEVKESPTVATSVADSIEYPSFDQLQEPIVIPALAEAQHCIAPVAENITPVRAEELPKELEVLAFAVTEPIPVNDPCLNDQSNNDQPNQEEPIAIPALVEAQPPTAIVAMREEEELTTELETSAAAVPIQIAVEGQRIEDQRRDQINEALRIVIPMLVEAQASDPVPTAVAPEHKVGELPNELESPALDFPKQIAIEEQRPDLTCHEQRIVIPALIETQASEPAPVAAEQVPLEQEKKEEVLEMLETPMSASEVEIVEVKIVESPAIFNPANHRPGEEKSKAIDKGSDAPPKPTDVSGPVVVHVNLGELRVPKGTPERAPAPTRYKKVDPTEPETSRVDISSDAYASEPPVTASSRRFDIVTFALGVVVLACSVLLITLVSLRLMPHHVSAEPVRRAKPAYNVAPTADQNANSALPTAPPLAPSPAQTPSTNDLSSSAQPGRTLILTPGLAEGNLMYRVEPDYPEEARRQGIQGPVVLDLHIGKDGAVQGVDLVSGQPLLVEAATAAVKQWRFRTRYVNGNEVEMQARITLHFALPTP